MYLKKGMKIVVTITDEALIVTNGPRARDLYSALRRENDENLRLAGLVQLNCSHVVRNETQSTGKYWVRVANINELSKTKLLVEIFFASILAPGRRWSLMDYNTYTREGIIAVHS